MFKDYVVSAFQWDEASAGDFGCKQTTILERDHHVITTMQHQGRNFHLWKEIHNVDLA